MSEPSFKLSKRADGEWVAEKRYPSRGVVKVECGDGTRANAEKKARLAFAQRDRNAEAGRTRWRKTRAAKAAAPAPTPPAPTPPPSEPEPEPAEEPTPIERPSPPPPDPPPAAASPERNEQIRLKLLALGDGMPIEPDAVVPPGEDPRVDDEPRNAEDAAADNEAGELIADMIAGALTVAHVKLVAKRLKKHKPPKRPGEANERMMEWERAGIKYNAAKLFGSSTRLGPTGKMLVGAVLVTLGMYVDAEPLEAAAPTEGAASPEPSKAAEAAPPPTPAPPAPAAPTGGGGRIFQLHPLGVFK